MDKLRGGESIYTAYVDLDNPSVGLNTVMWRLAVACGWVVRGAESTMVDSTELLEYVEDQLFRLAGRGK